MLEVKLIDRKRSEWIINLTTVREVRAKLKYDIKQKDYR